jgi:hypothetical protein
MAFQTPDWVKHAVFYQNLSPRRFAFTLRVDSPCKKEDAKGGRHTLCAALPILPCFFLLMSLIEAAAAHSLSSSAQVGGHHAAHPVCSRYGCRRSSSGRGSAC